MFARSSLRKPHALAAVLMLVLAFVGFGLWSQTASGDRTIDQSTAEALSNTFSDLAERATPSVVFIDVERKSEGQAPSRQRFDQFWFGEPFDFFGESPFHRFFKDLPQPKEPRQAPRRIPNGQGSGFLVSEDGLILTNNHVVTDAERINVRLHDGRNLRGTLVGSDPESDVALVRIDAKGLPALRLGDSAAVRVGEWVVAIGNPFGLNETVTSGIVSAKGRTRVGLANYENFIQTDAAINPGNSGGPLLNLKGEVVGINAAIYSRSGGYMGIGFAIPINLAKAVQRQLLDGGEVVRGYLGVLIQDLTPELAASFGQAEARGALIADVTDDSPASKAGLKPGDVVTAMDGTSVRDSGTLRNEVALRKPGTQVAFSVWRDGAERTITATLGKREAARQAETDTPAGEEQLGLSLEPLSQQSANRLGLETTTGVLVRGVVPGSAAARAGLASGQVILEVARTPVDTPEAFWEAIKAQGKVPQVLLRVREADGVRFLALRLD